jgi:hypothetical protein
MSAGRRVTGPTPLGVLFIDLFFLPEELRRGGAGSRLLRCLAFAMVT